MGSTRHLVFATVAVLGACGPGGREGDDQPGIDAMGSGSDSGGTQDMSRVYAHSRDTLYRLNPLTLSPMRIGTMTGVTGSLLDLAVDKNDRIVGTSSSELYLINSSSGGASVIRELDQGDFTSLSFIYGANPNDPDILVAASKVNGDVYRIDEVTGTPTKIGNYGTSNGMQVKSSGDIFGVRGYGIFATVDIGTDGMDYLARVDPSNNWTATPLPQNTGYNKIFGLGFWGGKIYGFVDTTPAGANPTPSGAVIEIDSVTGTAIELARGTEQWFGAGVTTNAPIIQ